MRLLETLKLERYFLFATIISFAAAIAFTLPVIVPEYTFPLELTNWPGSWMFEAYFSFLIVGVLGNLGWATLLDMVRRNMGKDSSVRYLSFTHLVLSNVAVYGATGFMFAVGYRGGAASLLGYGKAVITQAIIGWMVVPIGVFIYLYIIASVFGIANLLWMLESRGKHMMNGTPDLEPGAGSAMEHGATRRVDLSFWGALLAAFSALWVFVPTIEIPYYPSNYDAEIQIRWLAVVGLLMGIALIVYVLAGRRTGKKVTQ